MNGLSIDDELDLIKRRKTPAQLDAERGAGVMLPPAAAPAPAPAKTPAQIDAELGLPPSATDLAPMPANDAGTWDVLGAAWKAETIKTDAWNETTNRRRALTEEMWGLLSKEGQARVTSARGRQGWASMEQLIADEAARQAATSPEAARVWAGFPLSLEAFNQQIDAGRKADLDEAQAILDQPGGGAAEFIGSAARAITDETSVMLLPFGISGSAWRTIASEAALGAAGEAAVLPKEFRVAEELGLAKPDAVSRIALGAFLGGGLASAVLGLGKGYRALRARQEAGRASVTETMPDGTTRVEHEAAIDAAEAELRGDQTVQERLGTGSVAGGARAEGQAGTLGAILDGEAPASGIAYSGVAEAGAGYTVLVGPDGKAVRREGSRNWRNNNPGNIEFGPFARSMGAIGTDGRFAVFPTYEQGRKAKATLLWGSKGYRGKTIAGAIARYAPSFENDTGAYTRAITKALGLPADTPMAALTPAQREIMMDAMERVEGFKPGTENGVQARAPRKGISTSMPDEDVPSFGGSTSRGYTGTGQVRAGDDFTIDVDWEIVDASTLIRASGDLQPRDRSRIASDAWIADTAARLDPAQLMPSPTADRGTPIIGPDNIIESGNGRFGAIERAYARFPDRAAAYRSAIEAAGYVIPEGTERPVLVARRRTELTPAERQRFAVQAQDSGVAVMTPTEMARAQSRAMTGPVLGRLDPAASLRDAANGDFVRAALAGLPRSARNAMFDASGLLNASGERQLREAIFARAWPDPDILARFTETDAGELKSLMEALDRAAPAWAALKADIEAGLVSPEMDISPFVLDAMRLIGAARDLSRKQGLPIAKAVQELLDEVDLLEGAISPLTAAVVRKFWTNGRAAKADDIASFLTRYADDARKAGATGGLFDAPTPQDILRTIDPEGFTDLPEDLGAARGFARPGQEAPPEAVTDLPGNAFDQGAQSPEAEATHAEIETELRGPETGAFGSVHRDLAGKPEEAIDRLLRDRDGDAIAALSHPDVEQPIDLVYGRPPAAGEEGYGLAKIAAKHPEVLPDLQGFLQGLHRVKEKSGSNRIRLTDDAGTAVVRLDFNGQTKTWLMTAFEKRAGKDATTDTALARAQDDTAGQGTGTTAKIGDPAENRKSAELEAMADATGDAVSKILATARRDLGSFADAEIDLPDGTTARAGDVLDDIEADQQFDAFLQACATQQTGAAQ